MPEPLANRLFTHRLVRAEGDHHIESFYQRIEVLEDKGEKQIERAGARAIGDDEQHAPTAIGGGIEGACQQRAKLFRGQRCLRTGDEGVRLHGCIQAAQDRAFLSTRGFARSFGKKSIDHTEGAS